MSKRDEEDFAAFLQALEAPTVDAGPQARRAAAGMPPMAGLRDPSEPSPVLGANGRPARPAGKNYEFVQGLPGHELPVEAYGPDGKIKPDVLKNARIRGVDAMEMDPLAQNIVGGLMGYGAGRVVPAVAAGAPGYVKALQRVVSGAAEGEVASDVQGGRPGVGAAVGGAVGALSAAGRASAAATEKSLYRELGRGAGEKAQAKLEGLGPDQIMKTSRDFGILTAGDHAAKSAAAATAKDQVGKQIGAAWKQIDAAGGARAMQPVTDALEGVKDQLSKTTSGKQLAQIVTEKQEALRAVYGDNIPASALNKEITDLQTQAYSGPAFGQLSPVAAKKAQRMMAKALDGELDTVLSQAKKNPQLAGAVDSIGTLNPQYKSLVVLDGILQKKAVKEPFKPTIGERFAADPGKTSAQVAAGMATAIPRGLIGAGRTIAEGTAPGSASIAGAAAQPQRKVAPAVVPMIESLSSNNGAGLDKHAEKAIFGP